MYATSASTWLRPARQLRDSIIPEGAVRDARRHAAGRAVGGRSTSISATDPAVGAARPRTPADVRIRRAAAGASEADRRRAAPRLRPHPRDRGADRRRICAEPRRHLSDADPAAGHGPDRRGRGRRAAQGFPGDRTRAAIIWTRRPRRSKPCSSGWRSLPPSAAIRAGPAIGRAVKNLMTALSHRVGRDGLDEDLLHEIAAILDEAAQRIERVK